MSEPCQHRQVGVKRDRPTTEADDLGSRQPARNEPRLVELALTRSRAIGGEDERVLVGPDCPTHLEVQQLDGIHVSRSVRERDRVADEVDGRLRRDRWLSLKFRVEDARLPTSSLQPSLDALTDAAEVRPVVGRLETESGWTLAQVILGLAIATREPG
jgi:hypothetical protein